MVVYFNLFKTEDSKELLQGLGGYFPPGVVGRACIGIREKMYQPSAGQELYRPASKPGQNIRNDYGFIGMRGNTLKREKGISQMQQD